MKWKATSRIMEAGDDDKINEELSYLSQRYSGFEYVDMKHIPYGNSKDLYDVIIIFKYDEDIG